MDEVKTVEETTIEEHEKKIFEIIKKRWVWTTIFLIILLVFGAYIRSLPMQDHSTGAPPSIYRFVTGQAFNGRPGLWNIATDNWTLGPDLDPWLFTRYAREMIEGTFPKIDSMRYVPHGFDNSFELQMVSYMIILTYKITNIFGMYNVIFAAALMPVLLFLLTIVAFFLFVREIFLGEDENKKTKANIIALISTFFMITIPAFLSRTIAGIPEKESVAFFFMFAAFYLFLKAWKSKKTIYYIIFGALSGIATALMGLTWGGVVYIYVTIALAISIAFLLNKIGRKESIIYALWIITSLITTFLFTTRYSLKAFATGVDTGLATFLFFIIIIHFILWDTKINNLLSRIKFFNETKIPKNILSIIIGIIILFVLVLIIFGPSFFLDKLATLNKVLFNPITGRWSTTVAENRQPYFQEWASEFGPTIKQLPNVPIMFWMFFIGSVVLFKSLLSKLKKKDAWILTGLYVLFFFGLVFSRYAPHPAFFDGEDLISKSFYLGSTLVLALGLGYYYFKYEKEGDRGFEEIDFKYILLFALFVLCLFTARSAIRLIMVLGPIAPIFVGFLIVELIDRFKKSRDETWRVITGAFMILILIASVFCLYTYSQQITGQAYSFIPSYYNQQWQKAMKWVSEETPKSAVFAHWWDYGYWVQSIGERATVTDGGNAYVYWNYLSGRYVLTGDNQADSLEFLYNHNASYLLIDSSDIGKYGAFASIGSDKNFDRYSWIGTFLIDETKTEETKNETRYAYLGGVALDEDISITENGKQVLLPGQRAGVGAIILPLIKQGNLSMYGQPYAMIVYNGVTHRVNLRYLAIAGDSTNKQKFIDFKSGAEACAFMFPQVTQSSGGISKNEIGAAMFISPRLLRGYLAQKYILDDPFNKFPNFIINNESGHIEPNSIVQQLNSPVEGYPRGLDLPNIVYFQGVQGPITIWEIKYSGKEKIRQDYQDTDFTKYLDWEL